MTIERRDVSGFDRLRFRGPGVLKVIQGDTESVTIHAPGYAMEDIESRVVNGELKLGYTARQVVSLAIHREVLSYTLHVRELQQIKVVGVGVRVLIPDLDGDQVKLSLSGQGHVILEHLTADRLDARISGAGLVQVKGDVEEQGIRVEGAGHYRAHELVSDFASVRISGAGKADLTVSAELDVHISGAGLVSYEGYPEVTRQISGFGRLTRRRRREQAPLNGEDHG